ncbi:nuclear transport factor 2 family protein [Peterkaempfera bronchialis]|uniref:nuclear transport factor 2 family protein n=1 Tax=Peterkaempfera bronchialis TaxID=2126346 RepID=UPI003C2B5D20
MQEETARFAIDTFISAFSASNDSYVTALLSQALTSDVVFWGPLGRSEGIAAVERFVLDIRRHPAGTGTMVRCSEVDMPDEWARYQWVFTSRRSASWGAVQVQPGQPPQRDPGAHVRAPLVRTT